MQIAALNQMQVLMEQIEQDVAWRQHEAQARAREEELARRANLEVERYCVAAEAEQERDENRQGS